MQIEPNRRHLVLTLRAGQTDGRRIDMRGVCAASSGSEKQLKSLMLRVNGGESALEELFDVSSETCKTDGSLTIRAQQAADLNNLDFVGHGLCTGSMMVEGSVGHYAAQNMSGGELMIHGDAGDFAANAMQGGSLRIMGHAGDWLGAALIGERSGMNGGVVAVNGNVGARLGDRMRRGLVLVGGNAGSGCGTRFRAGSIVVAGSCGPQIGSGLRRGSLIIGQAPESIASSFSRSGQVDLNYLRVLYRYIEHILPDLFLQLMASKAQRYMGDLAYGGKGEILVLSKV